MSSKSPTDTELMLYADGELFGDEARAVAEHLERDERARDVVAGVREVGEAVRGALELQADAAKERQASLDGMWSAIERRLEANGTPRGAAAEAAPAAKEAAPGLFDRIRAWLAEQRGHMVTGLVAAGATAAVLMAVLPMERKVEVVRERRVEVPATVEVAPAASLESQAPEVENLEVYDGNGMILTIPGDEEGDSGTAVIWITPEEDTLEGPI